MKMLKLWISSVLLFVLFLTGCSDGDLSENRSNYINEPTLSDSGVTSSDVSESVYSDNVDESFRNFEHSSVPEIQVSEYKFRNQNLLDQHYEKHGKDMGFSSAEEYEKAAAAVPNDPEVLHKNEKEDGDDVYYIERTNEFVIISTDGYIRTYFNPDRGIDYYNKQ